MQYSIVIPAHNEAENIEKFVSEFIARLSTNVRSVLREVIIVENGSRDGTLEACNRLHGRFPALVRVLSNQRGSYGEPSSAACLSAKVRTYLSWSVTFLTPISLRPHSNCSKQGGRDLSLPRSVTPMLWIDAPSSDGS